ncbi:MAG: phosphatase PAP2 family protein [Candidatus Bathyarchaeia archaeon]
MVDEVGSKLEAKSDYRSSRILGVALPAVYLLVLSAFCLAYGVLPGPELIALCFFVYAAYNKWTRRFVKDWFPFVSLFLSYEAMNGLVGSLALTVHVSEPINLELRLFGSIPTLVLQQFCRTPFLDYLCAFFYSLHFIAPAVFGFLLWKYRPENFGKYVLVLAIGTYSALVTFLIYPVAPPWSAVTGVTRILLQVDKNIGIPFYRTLIDFVSANPNAAFPSLHAMYPWLISLFAFKIKKAKALPIIVFPIGVWFSAVYLGEHYVIDVIGGVIYGTCAFLIAEKLIPLFMQRVRKGAKVLKPEGPS